MKELVNSPELAQPHQPANSYIQAGNCDLSSKPARGLTPSLPQFAGHSQLFTSYIQYLISEVLSFDTTGHVGTVFVP